MRSFGAGPGDDFVVRKMMVGSFSMAGLIAWKVEFGVGDWVELTAGDSDVVESAAAVAGDSDVVVDVESCCLISAGTISFVPLKTKCFDSDSNPDMVRDLFM